VLKGKPTIEGRPGASLPSMNLDSLEARLKEKYGNRGISKRDVLSAALYPKVRRSFVVGGARARQWPRRSQGCRCR
jgi:pyruvate carboxylase